MQLPLHFIITRVQISKCRVFLHSSTHKKSCFLAIALKVGCECATRILVSRADEAFERMLINKIR